VRRFLALFVVAASLVLAACGAVTPFAAIVNGERIAQKDLDSELKAIRGNKAYVQALQTQAGLNIQGTAKNTFDMAFVTRVLNRRIYYTLIHQEVARRKLKIDDAAVTAARRDAETQLGGPEVARGFTKAYLQYTAETTAEITALQAAVGEGEATPQKIKDYYEANKAQFEETCVSHILVDTEEKAKELKTELDKGGDFAALAKANSKDNQGPTGGSAANGGSLDCITTAQSASFVPEFVAGYKDLPVGAVSGPVKTQFGYHLIKVTDRKQQSLEDATEEIKGQLSQSSSEQFQTLLTSMARKAKIRVNPKYGHFDKDRLSVVAPTAPPAAGTATTAISGLTPGG
jgi:foldase protein PrsA